MTVTAILSELAEAAHWVAAALPKRPASPDLHVMHLVADAEGLHIEAGEWTHYRSVTVQATTDGPLDVQLPGRVLADYLDAQRAPTAILEPLDGALLVKGRGQCTIPTVARHPMWPTATHGEMVGELDAAELAVALASVDGHIRPQAQAGLDWENAVEIGRTPDGLFVQGGSPYSVGRADLDGGWVEDVPSALVSPWALRDCLRGTSGALRVELAGSVWRFTTGRRTFVLGAYDVQMPDFGRLLFFAERARGLEIDSEGLQEMIHAVRLGSDVIRLQVSAGELTVSSWADTKGRRTTGDASVSAGVTGDDVDLRLNAEFLSVALGSIEGVALLSWATNGKGPVRVANEGGTVRHMIAPVRNTEGS